MMNLLNFLEEMIKRKWRCRLEDIVWKVLSSAVLFRLAFQSFLAVIERLTAMDVLLAMPDELLRHLLSEWFDITTIARLDSAYVSHNSRVKFISHVYNSKTVFTHNARISAVSTNKQQEFVEWLVRRRCRVRCLCISIELQRNEELMTEFFRVSGSSLQKIEIRERESVPHSDLLWVLLKHCSNLQEFCVKGCFPEISDFLHELSVCCPYIQKLSITSRLGYTVPGSVLGQSLHFKKLRCLDLTYAVFAGELLAAIAPESTLLEELNLASNRRPACHHRAPLSIAVYHFHVRVICV